MPAPRDTLIGEMIAISSMRSPTAAGRTTDPDLVLVVICRYVKLLEFEIVKLHAFQEWGYKVLTGAN